MAVTALGGVAQIADKQPFPNKPVEHDGDKAKQRHEEAEPHAVLVGQQAHENRGDGAANDGVLDGGDEGRGEGLQKRRAGRWRRV